MQRPLLPGCHGAEGNPNRTDMTTKTSARCQPYGKTTRRHALHRIRISCEATVSWAWTGQATAPQTSKKCPYNNTSTRGHQRAWYQQRRHAFRALPDQSALRLHPTRTPPGLVQRSAPTARFIPVVGRSRMIMRSPALITSLKPRLGTGRTDLLKMGAGSQ